MKHVFPCLIVCSFFAAASLADDREAIDSFAVFRVETELQRALLREKYRQRRDG